MLDLQSSAHGRFYAFFEANCAMTFCRALLLHGIAYEGTIGNGLDTSRPLREMFPLWLRSTVSTVCVPPLRRAPRRTADPPAARGRSSSDLRDPDTVESELVASTSSWRREALRDMPTVAKIELTSTSEPCDAGAELSNPKWTEEEDLDNPFRFMPTFMSVCSFCGSGKLSSQCPDAADERACLADRCSRFVRGDDKRINCKKLATHLRTGGKRRRLCEYRCVARRESWIVLDAFPLSGGAARHGTT